MISIFQILDGSDKNTWKTNKSIITRLKNPHPPLKLECCRQRHGLLLFSMIKRKNLRKAWNAKIREAVQAFTH